MNTEATTPMVAGHPLIEAWEKYKETADFQKAKDHVVDPNRLEGVLWGVFYDGWEASQKSGIITVNRVSEGIISGCARTQCVGKGCGETWHRCKMGKYSESFTTTESEE